MNDKKQTDFTDNLTSIATTPFAMFTLFLLWIGCGAIIAHFWSDCDVVGKLIWVCILSGWILITPLVVSILFAFISMGAQLKGQMSTARFFSKAAFQLYWTSTIFLAWTGKSSLSLPALTYQAVLFGDCQFKEAEQVTGDLVSFFEQKFGKDSKAVAGVLDLHARSLMDVGKLREAVECAKRVEAISQKTKDFSYPESICHVAEIYRMGGQYSVAQNYYQQSIEKCLALTKGLEQHEQLQRLAEGNAAITRCKYAMALYKSGNITSASSQIEKSLSTMTKQCLETSSASTFAQAALISAKLNQPDKADEYIAQAKSRYAKHGNEIKLELLDKFELLGEYAMIRNRFEEAEENYKQGIALSEEIGIENSVLIMLTLEGYAELLRKMNREQEAIVYQQRFEVILKHATEELSPTTLDPIN